METKKSAKKVVKKTARKTAVKKNAPTKNAKKSAPKKAAPRRKKLTDETIALEAYYIAEERYRNGIPGTPHGDWLEAERRLRARVS